MINGVKTWPRRPLIAAAAVLAAGAAMSAWIFSPKPSPVDAEQPAPAPPKPPVLSDAEVSGFASLRRQMVEDQLRVRDIVDPEVLRAMGSVPRHCFVPEAHRAEAYDDHPLPIGHGQTISQPYVVALMTQVIRPNRQSRVLDVGTGSGYQAAVLAELCKEVFSIEIVKPLAEQARSRLASLGYKNVTCRSGDGYRGWTEHAPFDGIIVAAAASHVPQPLVDQLAPGGRLVMPVGRAFQELLLVERHKDGRIERRHVTSVAFVPMTGEAQQRER